MKKIVCRILVVMTVVAVLGLVGSMDYKDQGFDAARSAELRRSIGFKPLPPGTPLSLDAVCLVAGPVAQHCSNNSSPSMTR